MPQPQLGNIQRQLWRLLCVPLATLLFSAPTYATEVEELMNHIDELWRGDTSRAVMSMTVETRRYQRTMKMEAWSKGKDYSLVVIREPKKDAGIATLKVEENIWNYLPKINRVTKVPPSMMSGSWMGSHFTNDDLVKESSFQDDFDSTITFEGQRDGNTIYEVTSKPKPNAAVVWGKVVLTLHQDNLAPIQGLYYDEEEVLVRTMTFSEIEQIGNRAVPMRLTLVPEDKPGESTTIVYHEIEFGVDIPEGLFSLRSLQQRR